MLQCVCASFKDSNFIVSFSMQGDIDREKYGGEWYNNITDPNTVCNSWAIRVNLTEQGGFSQQEPGSNSIWLHDEFVHTILEYASSKLILSLDPSDLLLVEHWKPHRVLRGDPSNTEKLYIQPHPEFHVIHFPLLVCSGVYYYALINIKDSTLEPFVDQSCGCSRAQQAFFF